LDWLLGKLLKMRYQDLRPGDMFRFKSHPFFLITDIKEDGIIRLVRYLDHRREQIGCFAYGIECEDDPDLEIFRQGKLLKAGSNATLTPQLPKSTP